METQEGRQRQQLKGIISRAGSGNLSLELEHFLFSDAVWPRYRTSPASTAVRFHHAYEGGLLDHSIETADLALTLKCDNSAFTSTVGAVTPADMVTVALLHDLHKIGDADGQKYFLPNMIKNGTVRSDKIPYASSDVAHHFRVTGTPDPVTNNWRQLDYLCQVFPDAWSDGDLSLSLVFALAPSLMALISEGAKFAIRHHAGMYDRMNRGLLTGKETPLQVLMHFVDMVSSRRIKWSTPETE